MTRRTEELLEELFEQQRVEQLLFLEARLIDERRFAEWEALWVDEGIYWVPANGEHTDPRTDVSLIYDNRSRMHNRVERYIGGKAYSQQPPPRTVHLVGNVAVEHSAPAGSGAGGAGGAGGADGGGGADGAGSSGTADVLRVVHSTVQVAESRPGARIDWVGRVTHHLVERQGALRIAFKRVVLVDNDQELTTIDFLL